VPTTASHPGSSGAARVPAVCHRHASTAASDATITIATEVMRVAPRMRIYFLDVTIRSVAIGSPR
jgi:hypothetical protein